MNWLNNMKIGKKMIAAFLIVALLSAASGVYGVMNILALNNSSDQMYQEMIIPITKMAAIDEAFQRMRVNLRQAIILDDPTLIKEELAKLPERTAEIDGLIDELNAIPMSDDNKLLFSALLLPTKKRCLCSQMSSRK